MGIFEMSQQAPLNKSRADKFILALTYPDIINSINDKTKIDLSKIKLDSLEISLREFEVPSIEISSITVPYGTQSIKVTSHKREPPSDVDFNFVIDNEYRNYYAIYKWLSILNDDVEGVSYAKNSSEYSSDLSLFGLNEYNEKKIEFIYKGAFPVAIDSIKWDYKEGSEIICNAKFSYSKILAYLM